MGDYTGHPMGGLIVKEVTISPKEIIRGTPTEDQIKLAEKRIYIAVYNSDREELDLIDLEKKIGAVKKKISEIHDPGDLKKSLGSLKSLVKFTKNSSVLNESLIDIMRKLAGRFLIVTNTDLPYGEIVSAYKEQWKIERTFRAIKSFLDIRPVYHRKFDRIKAHVFVCVLSFLVSAIMEKSTGKSIKSIRKDLNCLDIVPLTVENRRIYVSSDSPEASSLLKSLKIPYPRIHESAHT
ncbi:MAG: transposase [Thermoplasmatales archaeon]|nr:transposase [Thermoplasmatales archaeon]MCW6170359.1 transposase [Thermoplasmatales archaeon]